MQTFTGKQYLKIDIASQFGLDKESWNDRIAWFDENEHQLVNLLPQADEPAMFYAAVNAWNDVQAGKPIGYMINLDATASGMQVLAALTGDRKAAEICNVVDTGNREDAYTVIYHNMLDSTGGDARITRADCKAAIVPSLYSSIAKPKEIFGPLVEVYNDTMATSVPGVWALKEAMIRIWDKTASEYNWVMPDNFHIHYEVEARRKETFHFDGEAFDVFYKENAPIDQGIALNAHLTHGTDALIAREVSRRCNYNAGHVAALRLVVDKRQRRGVSTSRDRDQTLLALWSQFEKSGYLSARVMDYIDADNVGHVDAVEVLNLIDSLPAKPFKVVTVHDCFRALPHYGNDLRRQYNLQLELIAKSNLLNHMLSQIMRREVSIDKLDPTLWQDIGATNYALS